MLYPAELRMRMLWPIVLKKRNPVNGLPVHFSARIAYTVPYVAERRGSFVRETDDPNADLEDLIFDEDMGGPSER